MKRILLLLLVCSLQSFAQHVHTGPTPNFGTTMTASPSNPTDTAGSPVSQLDYCDGHLGSFACFHPVSGGSLPIKQVSTAQDASLTLALDTTDPYVYRYDPNATQPFLSQPQYGSGVTSLAVGAATNIWSLGGQLTCNPGFYAPYKWTGSAWNYVPACFSALAADSNGKAYGVGGSSNLPYYSSGSLPWTPMLGTPEAVRDISASGDGNSIITVGNSGQIYLTTLDPVNGWAAWAPIGTNIGAIKATITVDPFLGLVIYAARPVSGNQIRVEVWDGTKWDSFNNDTNYSVLAAGPQGAFSSNSAGTLTRYSHTGFPWTHMYTVKPVCNPSPCPSTVHDYHSTLTIKGRTFSAETSAPATDKATVTVSGVIDPFGEPGSQDGPNDFGHCPVAGTLYNLFPIFFPVVQQEWCKATFTKAGVGYNCGPEFGIGPTLCDYNVVPYCTPATTPPDADPWDGKVHNMSETLGDLAWGFQAYGECFRLQADTSVGRINLTPWWPATVALPLTGTQGPPSVCTKTP